MRIVIIGLGSIARKHLLAIRSLVPKLEVYALRSSPSAVAEHGIINLFSVDEIARLDPSFVLVSNPTVLRSHTLQQIVPLRIPLFIEKPVLSDLRDAELLTREIAAAGVLTYIACNLRFLSCLQFVQQRLQDREAPNEVNVYCGSYLPDWRPAQDYRTVYSANANMGGGVHLDLIHELDYLYWMFGLPQKTTARLRSVSTLDISSIDYANYLLEYPLFSASVVLNYYRRDYKRELEIVFSDTTWTVDLAKNSVTDASDNRLFLGENSIADTYFLQMSNFLQLLSGSGGVKHPFAEGVEVLKLAATNE